MPEVITPKPYQIYRPESFWEFVDKVKFPRNFWLLLFIYPFFLIITLLLQHGSFSAPGLMLYLFTTIVFLSVLILAYAGAYQSYRQGHRIVNNLVNYTLSKDVGVKIELFRSSSRKIIPKLPVAIYRFDSADLVFCKNSMIILGRSKWRPWLLYPIPIEITLDGKFITSSARAELKRWKAYGKRLTIELTDKNYELPVILEFQSGTEFILSWLERTTKTLHANTHRL